jgi:hypothetical protein
VIAMFFEKIKRVHRNISLKKDSETLFSIFCGLACEFCFKVAKKVLIGPKNFLLSKLDFWYRKCAEFHADSKTVEKNAIN